jgi:hypothetical protein
MAEICYLMKQIIILTLFLWAAVTSQAQGPIQPVLKTYFRTHPFDIRFSTFIKSLQQDPWFTIETYNRRTDSTFFFLSGFYKNFNPYKYVPGKIRLILAEEQFMHPDSLHTLDTVINLQLMGITDSTAAARNAVMKEFRRFRNSKGSGFSSQVYTKFEDDGRLTAEIYDYYIYPFRISPVTAAWGMLDETHEYTFTITIRFKVRENLADLILSPSETANLKESY